MDWPAIEALQYGEEDQPQNILGAHLAGRNMLYQTYLPGAAKVSVVLEEEDKAEAMEMVDEDGFFAAVMNHRTPKSYHYVVTDAEGNNRIYKDPYRYEVSLTEEEMQIIKPIIEHNDFSDIGSKTSNANVLRVLQYYCITREDAEQAMAQK